MTRMFSKKCSRCGRRDVMLATVPYEIRAHHDGRDYDLKIPALSVPQCGACGNISFDHDASEQVSQALRQAAKLLEPAAIQHQREKLGLSQAAVAEMLGVEAAEFGRWEAGEQIQSRSADRFLRSFFTVPELRTTLASNQLIELSGTHS